MQHEGHPLRWPERPQHDRKSIANSISQERITFWHVAVIYRFFVNAFEPTQLLTSPSTAPQHVQAKAGHDGREPAVQVLDG